MPETLDCRALPRDAHRDRLFEALDGRDTEESVTVLADHDLAGDLLGYAIERHRGFAWERTERDDGTWEVSVTKGEPLAEDTLPDFDGRELPPQRRHTVLLDTFDALEPGEGFVLVNDHDPKPLYHELRSTRGDRVGWDYRQQDPGAWRVAIRKTGPTRAPEGDVITAYDVRDIPTADRHETIHHRYGMIPAGETMAIIAPHEPRPLRREFEQRYGDTFTWEIREQEPGRCRVHVTKEASVDGGEAAGADDGATAHGCGHHDGGADHEAGPEAGSEADGKDPIEAGSEAEDGGAALSVTAELDVRDRPPAERHEAIFQAYEDLAGGEGFVLVNDHDPKPLYHQFDAAAGDEFRWSYRTRSPGEFRVLIGKAEASGSDQASSDGPVDAPF